MPEAGGTAETSTLVTDGSSQFGSVNIYSRSGFDFHAADINIFSSDTSVARITGGEAFNPSALVYDGRFNSVSLTADAGGGSGDLEVIAVTRDGVIGVLGALFDPLFDHSIDPSGTANPPGSFLIARVDFEIVGEGTAEFSLDLDEFGVHTLPDIVFVPTFGSATLEVGSSVVLGDRILGDVNLDGGVNFLDIFPFIWVLSTPVYLFEADMDRNQEVNFLDIQPFITTLFSASSGN